MIKKFLTKQKPIKMTVAVCHHYQFYTGANEKGRHFYENAISKIEYVATFGKIGIGIYMIFFLFFLLSYMLITASGNVFNVKTPHSFRLII